MRSALVQLAGSQAASKHTVLSLTHSGLVLTAKSLLAQKKKTKPKTSELSVGTNSYTLSSSLPVLFPSHYSSENRDVLGSHFISGHTQTSP